jgi:hypothetical protein
VYFSSLEWNQSHIPSSRTKIRMNDVFICISTCATDPHVRRSATDPASCTNALKYSIINECCLLRQLELFSIHFRKDTNTTVTLMHIHGLSSWAIIRSPRQGIHNPASPAREGT